ncbi:MAG: FAD-dependent oxidoreductase, partial [Bacteroidota bacterium]
HVVVIGGGDTASDCIGTARRQGALSITNIHYRPAPPTEHPVEQVWPFSAPTYEVSTSHAEGCARIWSVQTTRFEGTSTHVERLYTTDVVPGPVESYGRRSLRSVEGTERAWQADLVLLAIGYLGPERQKMLGGLGVDIDTRGRIRTSGGYGTSRPGVFSAGDSRRGASLIVWAISEGREAAREVDAYLMGESALPAKGAGGLYS